MPFDAIQRNVLEHYAGGDFFFAKSFKDIKKHSDDPMLTFILREVGTADDIEVAMDRVNSIINDATDVFTGLMKLRPYVEIKLLDERERDVALRGWYILSCNSDGSTFDAVGPFGSDGEARDYCLAGEFPAERKVKQ